MKKKTETPKLELNEKDLPDIRVGGIRANTFA